MNIKLLMDFTNEIWCTDKCGIKNCFLYNVEQSDFEYKWTFRIVPADTDVENWFEFAVTKTIDNKGKVTLMNHYDNPNISQKAFLIK